MTRLTPPNPAATTTAATTTADFAAAVDRDTAGLIDFIANSPSSYHAADTVAAMLDAAGFRAQDATDAWDATPGGHYLIRGGAIVAWVVPDVQGTSPHGFRIVGAHTDSPGFKLKPNATLSSHGWTQAHVEVYGGPLLHTWTDRELELAGRVVLADGSMHLVRTGPLLRIPNLAIHLDRSVNEGLRLDPERHVQPVLSHGATQVDVLDMLAELCAGDANTSGASAPRIIAHDVLTADTQRGTVWGAMGEFVAAGRLDNLTSTFAGFSALVDVSCAAAQAPTSPGARTPDIAVCAAFDHEEVGSATPTGAAGPLLEEVLTRTATALGADAEAFRQMLARSTCVSADAAHAVHPNYPDKHDSQHHPMLGAGPVIKYNAKARYATDAESAAVFIQACEAAGVPYQSFVSDNRIPCGSTIGPHSATRLGIPTVDVGIGVLSMHSAREMCGSSDLSWLRRALASYWTL